MTSIGTAALSDYVVLAADAVAAQDRRAVAAADPTTVLSSAVRQVASRDWPEADKRLAALDDVAAGRLKQAALRVSSDAPEWVPDFLLILAPAISVDAFLTGVRCAADILRDAGL